LDTRFGRLRQALIRVVGCRPDEVKGGTVGLLVNID
jgi:hypothetical protein